jgi:hypothetical protein
MDARHSALERTICLKASLLLDLASPNREESQGPQARLPLPSASLRRKRSAL